MRLVKGSADEQVYVSRNRHEENEKIRKATESFLKWRGRMFMHGFVAPPKHHVDELYEAWHSATGLDLEEYT